MDDGLRLPLVLRKLCVLLELELGLDLALLLKNLCGNIGGPQELGMKRSDVHGDVLGDVGIAALKGAEHADALVGVDIESEVVAVENSNAADVHVLAQLCDKSGKGILYGGAVSKLCCLDLLNVIGVSGKCDINNLVYEILEVIAGRNEVGLAVDLNDYCPACVSLSGNYALGGDAA